MNEKLYLHRGYLDERGCKVIIDAMLRAYELGGFASTHTRTRTAIPASNLKRLPSKEAFDIVTRVRKEIVELVTEFYCVQHPLWNDYTMLSDLHDGDFHPRHADNEKLDSDGKWVPNHTPWRSYTAMLYLNTSGKDFQGGHIRFLEIGEDIAPEKGLIVGFRCDQIFVHETTPVTNGNRYAVSLWMTSDKNYAENW
jgi:hypothetical protein